MFLKRQHVAAQKFAMMEAACTGLMNGDYPAFSDSCGDTSGGEHESYVLLKQGEETRNMKIWWCGFAPKD